MLDILCSNPDERILLAEVEEELLEMNLQELRNAAAGRQADVAVKTTAKGQ